MGQAPSAVTPKEAAATLAAWRHEIIAGLTAANKRLSPTWFYDERGSQLFDEICTLPEYYATRTELDLLKTNAAEIAALVGARAEVVELGAGSSLKARLLLGSLDEPASYLPVDVSADYLRQQAADIAERFRSVAVHPVVADFTRPFTLPRRLVRERTLVFFPGSTIGNFELPQAAVFLRRIRKLVGAGGGLLIGADLHKDRRVLELAYNDPARVTAAFNLNLLARINRECGADFDLSAFRHHAPYDEAERRIEMRLIAERRTRVTVPVPTPDAPPAQFTFDAGDHIITEYSHKYTVEGFRELAERTGWSVCRLWLDENAWFGVWLLAAAG